MLNRPEEYHRMAQAELRLWWYRALHHLVDAALESHPRRRDARILDAGCGTGGLLKFLREREYSNLRGFDLSADAVAVCHERGLAAQQGNLLHMNQLMAPETLDVIITNDTLCYFDTAEQRQVLALCAQALAPDGWLVLNVPALQAFRGIHDVAVGIKHRFGKTELRDLLAAAGFCAIQLRFWPFLLSPLIYASRLEQRVRLQNEPKVRVQSDIDLPPAWLNAVLEFTTRAENAVLPWKPFGSSLFAVAKKS